MNYRVITARLKARTAVHIGSGESNDLTDALIRRDTEGRPFIPGTAIAGALRTLATRLAPRLGHAPCKVLAADEKERSQSCSCAVCHLFGDINPTDEKGTQSASSRILVFNARLQNDTTHALIRDGVGIDRITGAAARAGSVKFDLEVLPAGAEFDIRLELRDTNEEDEQLLAAVLSEWQEGRAWLGGRVARGLGALTLDNLEYKTLDLNTSDSLMTFLQSDEPWSQSTIQPHWLKTRLQAINVRPVEDGTPPTVPRGWLIIEGVLQAEGPLLTNDTMASGASGFDHAPLLTRWGDWMHPVLTGAGLRGVLRSHAERLARSLTTHAVSDLDAFLFKCPACSPVENRPGAPLASCDALLKNVAKLPSDALVSDDHLCLACQLFGSTRRGSHLIVEDAPYAGEQPPKLKMFDFLAIDRFTGGGAEHLKFDALALWRPAFKLRLYLENPQAWELGWLALVLRDLEEGWLSVGFGAAKGFGRVKLRDWKATFGYLTPEDLPTGLDEPDTPGQSGIFKTAEVQGNSDEWRKVAGDWVKAFHQQVSSFERTELPKLAEDSYFGKVDGLYPVLKGDKQ